MKASEIKAAGFIFDELPLNLAERFLSMINIEMKSVITSSNIK